RKLNSSSRSHYQLAYLACLQLGEPERSIRPVRNSVRTALLSRNGKFCYDSAIGDAADLAGTKLCKPQRAIRADDDEPGGAPGCLDVEPRKGPRCGIKPLDSVSAR